MVNGKYVVTNPWTEEDRQRQKNKLAEKRIYMDEWDMSGTQHQHVSEQRPGKRKTSPQEAQNKKKHRIKRHNPPHKYQNSPLLQARHPTIKH